jgi:hypothetical protein
MKLDISFRNVEQQKFYWSRHRNNCFSGGFGNGKTWSACLRAITFLLTFPGYRIAIARQKLKNLRSTTKETFFQILPPELILRDDNQITHSTLLINGSLVYWLHLESWDEKSLKGLEINSALIDQAEEIQESIYLVLDGRVGRWSRARVPEELLSLNPKWPRNRFNEPRVHNYMDVLTNPDLETHWVYKHFHPDSEEKLPDHFYIEKETDENLYDPRTIESMKRRDKEWVDKYMRGKWGASRSAIHILQKPSVIRPNEFIDSAVFNNWLEKILKRAALYRVLDHGGSAPTCCLWFAAYKGIHICYREYYMAEETISFHRQQINFLSGDEVYVANYADPSIHHETAQKHGGYWSVAKEYYDSEYTTSPGIYWLPADNNELATRNRINELLSKSPLWKHPVTDEEPAPGLFFLKKDSTYPTGCLYSISQISAQRKKEITTENGRVIYSDERDSSVTDHAYDCVRYYVAMHNKGISDKRIEPPRRSFAHFNRIAKRRRQMIGPNH